MIIKQIINECLAEVSYYIESNGAAAIVDPLRNVSSYIEMAKQNKATIRYVFETHFHADFVSGHQELSRLTNASIVYGPTANSVYKSYIAEDNEVFELGDIRIKVLHTPGHTLESVCYLVYDESGKASAIFTGDTLLMGEVGRTDLVQHVRSELSPAFLAGLQYDAIRNKIFPLPNHLIVYPGHLHGSPCGKAMDDATFDTLGNQRGKNFALNPYLSREAYIKHVLENLPQVPPHFAFNVLLNQQGGLESVESLIKHNQRALSPEEFQQVKNTEDALIIDTRSMEAYGSAHIPGSLFVGLEANFTVWIGTVINNLQQALLLVTDEGKEADVIMRLANIGYDNVKGYLKGGLAAWENAGQPIANVDSISAKQLNEDLRQKKGSAKTLDARHFEEFQLAHLKNAHSFPLEFLHRNLKYLSANNSYVLYCNNGYRSLVAASCMMLKGFENIQHVAGGVPEFRQSMAVKDAT